MNVFKSVTDHRLYWNVSPNCSVWEPGLQFTGESVLILLDILILNSSECHFRLSLSTVMFPEKSGGNRVKSTQNASENLVLKSLFFILDWQFTAVENISEGYVFSSLVFSEQNQNMILQTRLFGGEISIATTFWYPMKRKIDLFIRLQKLWEETTEDLKFLLGFVSLKL